MTGWLTAIDPGAHTGWATFRDGTLVACGLGVHRFVGDVVIECPQIYRASKSKADPNDLIVLARRVGRIEEAADRLGAKCRVVLPREWKGSVPKNIHGARILAAMTEAERKAFHDAAGPAGQKHNILDAIGLGLWAVGRMP